MHWPIGETFSSIWTHNGASHGIPMVSVAFIGIIGSCCSSIASFIFTFRWNWPLEGFWSLITEISQYRNNFANFTFTRICVFYKLNFFVSLIGPLLHRWFKFNTISIFVLFSCKFVKVKTCFSKSTLLAYRASIFTSRTNTLTISIFNIRTTLWVIVSVYPSIFLCAFLPVSASLW